ncbi:MAG: DUF1249 domain-containing protein [Oceanospirillales bacterium]|uniref:DUF1249 domain-containing protein n=1 Tax=Marinobacterium halophilum TaxID=267374 RepID=A0A2P8ETC6_9GAMM|nr:DUF1249 domain-containing protein [Marinobacterium halophilum]MBR9827825.1 DUF1249 domain-containing protein [Oceanospirillales bacterium]PSL12702.1 hypothetical protein CLV44_11661 [Marinobacterium halophilum]
MKRKYIPDLKRQMAQGEANYMRLLKLLPDLDHCDQREFQVEVDSLRVRVRLTVDERFTYTTSVVVSQQYENASAWLESPQLVVRMYHDARVAEVICTRQRRQLAGVYPYPNAHMRQPDEKAQLNVFLGEWLSHCLAHGQMLEEVFAE